MGGLKMVFPGGGKTLPLAEATVLSSIQEGGVPTGRAQGGPGAGQLTRQTDRESDSDPGAMGRRWL